VANRERGFTLLEVLVAVALLGLVVSVLAGSAIQGMSYEGDDSRRTRASLLADRALWQIEAALKLGAPPQPSHEESQEGEEFRILVDVQPLDLSQGGLGALLAPAPEGPGAATPAPAPTSDGAAAPVLMPLYQVFVRVSWIEGLRELEVTRSTFAFDGSAAAQALGASAGAGAGEKTDDAVPTPEPEDLESE
jgi:prepilin-type N-terminal cleavage/methylation domain-containing protein